MFSRIIIELRRTRDVKYSDKLLSTCLMLDKRKIEESPIMNIYFSREKLKAESVVEAIKIYKSIFSKCIRTW